MEIIPKRIRRSRTKESSNELETKKDMELKLEAEPESSKEITLEIPFKTEKILIEKTEDCIPGINLKKGYRTDTGFDLQANLKSEIILGPGQRSRIGTGYRIKFPENLDVQIRPRSGLAFKLGLTVLNTPDTIDESYTGEMKVILINLGKTEIIITPEMKIAQLTFNYKVPVQLIEINDVIKERETERGEKGLGSTDLEKK
jgi:dUTP pyrophosphatase